MKSIKKIGFCAMFAVLMTVMFSSCLVVIDGTEDYESYDGSGSSYSYKKGSVKILNCDPDRDAYIQSVEYWDSLNGKWVECWSYSSNLSDSNISFKVKTGSHDFRITVIYPLYDGYQDYYDTFTTDANYQPYVSSYSTLTLKFDGSKLYETY